MRCTAPLLRMARMMVSLSNRSLHRLHISPHRLVGCSNSVHECGFAQVLQLCFEQYLFEEVTVVRVLNKAYYSVPRPSPLTQTDQLVHLLMRKRFEL